MLRCDDELLQLYVDGTLHPAEAALVEVHLEGCAACRRQVGTYKSLSFDLARSGNLAPAPTLDAALLAERLRAEHSSHRRPTSPQAATWDLSTLWLTANPAVLVPARAVSSLGQAGVQGLLRVGRRTWRTLLRRKGGG